MTWLEKAQVAMSSARRKLSEVLTDGEVWADDSKYVNPDIVEAAKVLKLTPGEVAGILEVVRRCAAVRGTTNQVRELEGRKK